MAEKRELDETDLEILKLLTEDARRPFRDIADHVSLTPPAVSDRVDRLLTQGIIRRFTVEIDHEKLSRQQPLLIELTTSPRAMGDVYEQVRRLDRVEHAFQTVDGRIIAQANAPEGTAGAWLRERLPMDDITSLDVGLLETYAWDPGLEEVGFSVSCVVCGNRVEEGGITTEIGGDMKAFCCPSCRAAYEERYEAHTSKM